MKKRVRKGCFDLRTILFTDITLMDAKGEVAIATILYARVSTAEQNIDHQLSQAKSAGFKIDDVIADHGQSGVSTKLSERPEGRRLFDILRAGDVLVVRWVDRLGRDYADVTATIRQFMAKGVVIKTIINGMTFDGATKDPIQQAVRDALIAFMAATAEAQADATRIAQRVGIAAAKSNPKKYRGRRPSYDRRTFNAVRSELKFNPSVSSVANRYRLSRQTVLRIRDDPEKAVEALDRWGL
jgi:putative DNA-invertase from lambdoid prophage Rac